jgi:MIO-dependent L-tyrosine 2,3-aminomutase
MDISDVQEEGSKQKEFGKEQKQRITGHDFIELDGNNLRVADVVAVSRKSAKIDIASSSKVKIGASRKMLEEWVGQDKVVYGITTGFGPMVSTLIPPKFQHELQQNLIRSHSANVGPLFSTEEVRAAMLLRANAFAKGYSAVRLELIDLLRQVLNKGIHPRVPQLGSVGASGDLTPSSHIALALTGEGEVEYQGEIMNAKVALGRSGLTPITLAAKEGLALINGTTMMTGVAALQVYDSWNLVKSAEVITALSMEALGASAEPFIEVAQVLKPHPGQVRSASNLRKLIEGSNLIIDNGRLEDLRKKLQDKMKFEEDVVDSGVHIQNVYSLRATPQILGAVRDSLDYITSRVTTEMNSANDNPLFLPEHGISYQGAHFHGQPVALPMDVLAISLCEIGVLSERRLNKMLDKDRSGGLSPFLARNKPGLQLGFEGAQYIPTALVAECRTLCNPASIQSIPSNAENQDVVSMGLIAARKARDVKEKIEYILAVELLAACEALEQRDKSKMAPATTEVHRRVRSLVPAYDTDRVMSYDFEKMRAFIHDGNLVKIAQNVVGQMQ